MTAFLSPPSTPQTPSYIMSIQAIIGTEEAPELFKVSQAFIDTFVDSLAKPETPKHCARYYLSCFYLFNLDPRVYTEFRCARPDVFAAVLRFLTIRRSDSAITTLEKRLSTCRCAETDTVNPFDSTHVVSAPPSDQVFPFLVDKAVSFITISFINTGRGPNGTQWPSLDNTRKEARKADKRGERFPWPKQPSDVFVNPPDMMLQTLWKLYHTYEQMSVIMFIHLLILAAGTTFSSVIHTIPDFPQQFTYHFDRVLSEKKKDSDLTFTMVMHILLYATNRFFEGDVPLMKLWQPHACETILAVTMALHKVSALPGPKYSSDPMTPTDMQRLIRCGNILLMFSRGEPKVMANIHRYHPAIIAESKRATPALEDNHIIAYDKIYRLVNSDRCHAPGCTETFSKQNRRFQACSGCRVVSYCSKECQALAWKHPDVPHKPFCAALVSYTKKIGVDWRKTAIRPQLDPTGVSRMCLVGGVTKEESTRLLNFDLELINWNLWFKNKGAVDGAEFRHLMATARHK